MPRRARAARPPVPRPAVLILASALLAVGACAPRLGDFGRPVDREGARFGNDIVGSTLASGLRNEPVSYLPFTDDEMEMRDRAWRFLMPDEERFVFDRMMADLSIRRYLPPSRFEDDTAYWRDLSLLREHRSVASLYGKLASDIEADLLLISPFMATAARVFEADAVRHGVMLRIIDAKPEEVAAATGRIGENLLLLDAVRAAIGGRARGYRHALERLTLAAPQHQAVPAERLLRALEAEAARIDDRRFEDLKDGVDLTRSSLPKHLVTK